MAQPTGVDTPAAAIEEWIDCTNEPLGEIGNGYQLTPTLQTLCLTNNRIKRIEHLESCGRLSELILRQNAISVIEGLDSLASLTELDLYMNAITLVPATAFAHNPMLKRLDLSFNQIRSLELFPSANLQNLEELYLIGNKIRAIVDLGPLPKLTMLELGDNRIRKIENLGRLSSLHGLWLGRNKITMIENLEPLTELRRISFQSNRIERIQGLAHLHQLEELYLSHNGLTSMDGISQLTSLNVLDVASNEITRIQGVENLTKLKEFWINHNKLDVIDDLKLLQAATELETVYLEGNPLASRAHYQRDALDILPNSLEQLDALLVVDVRKEMEREAVVDDEKADAVDEGEVKA